jgi:hypothetical protein
MNLQSSHQLLEIVSRRITSLKETINIQIKQIQHQNNFQIMLLKELLKLNKSKENMKQKKIYHILNIPQRQIITTKIAND